jgi:hypothetical protein
MSQASDRGAIGPEKEHQSATISPKKKEGCPYSGQPARDSGMITS